MPTERRIKRIREVARRRQGGLVVVLEDIHDPHNAAAVLRTAEAFGIGSVRFVFTHEKPFNPRGIGKKSSSSANRWIEYKKYRHIRDCTKELKKEGYEIIATALDPRAESVFSAKLSGKKIALLFGNESRGLTPEAVASADRIMAIPMRGMVQSLNLSVTASIFLFAVTSVRMKRMGAYLLPVAEANRLAKRIAH